MLQISPINSIFLHLENSKTPMHVSFLGVYDQSTIEKGKLRFKNIIRGFKLRHKDVPLLNKRIIKIPLNLDYPYTIDDPFFDIEYHLYIL